MQNIITPLRLYVLHEIDMQKHISLEHEYRTIPKQLFAAIFREHQYVLKYI